MSPRHEATRKSPRNHDAVDNKQLSMASILWLHLVPGIIIATAYALLVRPVTDLGHHKVLALGLVSLVVLVPLLLGIMLRTAKKETGRYSLAGVIGYRKPVPPLPFIGLVLLTFTWAGLAFAAIKPVNTLLTDWFAGILPDWYMLTGDMTGVSKDSMVPVLVSGFLFTGLIAPAVEELYFRGFLLPRMAWLGRYAVPLSAVLFALYHFWSPWQVVVRIIAIMPMIYAVQRTKNVGIAIAMHCMLNIVGDALPTLALFLAK